MISQQGTELRFVTWNTRGIKDPKKSGKISSQWLDAFNKLEADIVFIQETHIGPKDYKKFETVEGWKVYFTVYNPRSKGVAILIRDTIPFQCMCYDEDYSGSYIVLFCRLYGELYTLVNVYNHKNDTYVLYRLKEYLQETAEGVLVVGGDFNTVLYPYLDRRSQGGRIRNSQLTQILEEFTESLNLRDTWAHLHPTDSDFTRSEKDDQSEKNSASRLDMFFMPDDTIRRVSSCEIDKTSNRIGQTKISDHDPVVLTLRRVQRQSVNKIPGVALMLEGFTFSEKSDRSSGKINGIEILSAIKSMTDSGEEKPDELTVDYYKRNRCPLTEVLKRKYNLILKSKRIPLMYDDSHRVGDQPTFNVEYFIFMLILAKRLSVLLTLSSKKEKKTQLSTVSHYKLTSAEGPTKIKWSFLKQSLRSLTPIHFAPPHDFSILKSLLPKDTDCEVFRCLRQDCPLTRPILTLALKQLEKQLINNGCVASFSQSRQTLLINVDNDRYAQAKSLIEKFTQDSGIRLK